MPHVVIEYSESRLAEDVVHAMMQAAFEVCAGSGIMRAEDVKVRAVPLRNVLLQGGAKSFVHITLSMLAGRTAEQKEALAIALRARLGADYPDIDALSIDVRDMDPIAYKKRLRGAGT